MQLAKKIEFGEEKVKAMLNILVIDAAEFFRVGKLMGSTQVIETVRLIWQQYRDLKPEDFKLFFDELKLGAYGKIYDRFDGAVILEALGQFTARRNYEIELIRQGQNGEYKKSNPLAIEPTAATNPEIFKANMERLKASLQQNKIARENEKHAIEPPPRVISPIAQMHQRWLKQFTDLSMKQMLNRGIRMVRKYGLWLDVNAYLEYKQAQYQTIMTIIELKATIANQGETIKIMQSNFDRLKHEYDRDISDRNANIENMASTVVELQSEVERLNAIILSK